MKLNKKQINIMNKPFPITSVCRADLLEEIKNHYSPPTGRIRQHDISDDEAKKVALKITDDQMILLAEKMANAYCDSDFWIELEVLVPDILEGLDKNIKK